MGKPVHDGRRARRCFSALLVFGSAALLQVAPARAGNVIVDLKVLDDAVVRSAAPLAHPAERITLRPPPGVRQKPAPQGVAAPAKLRRHAPRLRERARGRHGKPEAPSAGVKVTTSAGVPRREARPSANPAKQMSIIAGHRYRLNFLPGQNSLDDAARRALDGLAGSIGDTGLRLQLRSYAGGVTDTESQARWVSLSRALSIRGYLMAKGIESDRIDVRALGRNSGEGPTERVDVIVTRN